MQTLERLSERHDLSQFDCGRPELNAWLARQSASSEGRSARTYVVATGPRAIGYYCVAAGAVIRGELPKAKTRQNLPNEVPVVVIGRLAVDKRFQARGVGKGLLRDAVLRALSAAEILGVCAILVHAIDEEAARFYRKTGFLPSPLNPLTLVLPVETVRRAL
jgi:GNAT superfamily N-acetyltransferase